MSKRGITRTVSKSRPRLPASSAQTAGKGLEHRINRLDPKAVALFLFTIFLTPVFTYTLTPAGADMGAYLNNALRVANGQLPYKDYWQPYPPGANFAHALLYRAFGLNINVIQLFDLLLSALIGVVAFAIGRILFKENYSSAITALLVFFAGVPASQGFTLPNFPLLFQLASAAFFLLHLRRRSYVYLFFSGVLCGVAALFKLFDTLPLAASLLFTSLVYGRDNRGRLQDSLALSSGFLLPIAAILLALWPIAGMMAQQTVPDAIGHGLGIGLPFLSDAIIYWKYTIPDVVGYVAFSGSPILMKMAAVAHYGAKLAYILAYFAAPFVLIGLAVLHIRSSPRNPSAPMMVFLAWGMLSLPKALTRADIWHFSLALTPLLFLVFMIRNYRQTRPEVWKALLLEGITVVLLLSVFFFLDDTQALLTTSPRYKAVAPHGVISYQSLREAYSVHQVILYIENNSREGGPLFVTPWTAPPFYALTNRSNPTRYDFLTDFVFRPSEEKQAEVCSQLLGTDGVIVVTSEDWQTDPSPDSPRTFNATNPLLVSCIKDNFKKSGQFGSYEIFQGRKYHTGGSSENNKTGTLTTGPG